MNHKEAALTKCILDNWPLGLDEVLFSLCSLPAIKIHLDSHVRLRATDVAWRELDMLSEPFQLFGRSTCLAFELKSGGIGYRSIGQVLFYKHILAPRHGRFQEIERLIFILIGSRPNPKRWHGKGNLESDAEEFLKLIRPEYWPDPDVHIFSYEQLGLQYDGVTSSWRWTAFSSTNSP